VFLLGPKFDIGQFCQQQFLGGKGWRTHADQIRSAYEN
jgi:hypothetical protein